MEIDNRLVLLGEQLKEHLGKGSKVKIAAKNLFYVCLSVFEGGIRAN